MSGDEETEISKATLHSYIIMPRYGVNLESYFESSLRRMSRSSVYQLGIRLLTIFEQIHAAGYTYNDIKLDNLMTDYQTNLRKFGEVENVFKDVAINIVDFGFASKFAKAKIDETGRKITSHRSIKE